jgi:hypothetical protein
MARTPLKRRGAFHINEAAVLAWKACDHNALHQALGLKPWDPSPLPAAVTDLGVDGSDENAWEVDTWHESIALQKELLARAGPPDLAAVRRACEANLKEAAEFLAYLRKDKPVELHVLKTAQENLAWRKKLLAELDAEAEGGRAK